jgi:penicillin V acylase-like amidase (Ntn superfamily)
MRGLACPNPAWYHLGRCVVASICVWGGLDLCEVVAVTGRLGKATAEHARPPTAVRNGRHKAVADGRDLSGRLVDDTVSHRGVLHRKKGVRMGKVATSVVPRQDTTLQHSHQACSTFVLSQGEDLIVGHNLDEPSDVPGLVVINKRGVSKTSCSWGELLTSRRSVSHQRSWVSRYGSATFNPLGREFADGGINEAGLCVSEMTLSESRYPDAETRPRIFMMLWIQYQLDNFESVDEVLENLSQFALDGWGWHFLVCDRGGNCAVIEFLDGHPVIYEGPSLPVPALCNASYSEELRGLEEYEVLGGTREVDLADDTVPRFVHAAHMLNAYGQNESSSAVDYAFEMLKTLERGHTKWSYVLDVRRMRVHFRSSVGRQIKHFDLEAFDLSCHAPAQVLDVNCDLVGDVSEEFRGYTSAVNRAYISQAFRSLEDVSELPSSEASAGTSLERLIDNMVAYPESTSCA